MGWDMDTDAANPVHRLAAWPAALPAPLRWAIVAFSVIVLAWLTQAPSEDLPTVNLWDKIEHALAFLALALLYGLLFPKARLRAAVAALVLGAVVEVLQAVLPFGRDAEALDLLADAIGVAAGLILLRLLAGPARLPT